MRNFKKDYPGIDPVPLFLKRVTHAIALSRNESLS
jgi:hypothetical protein